MPMVVTSDDDAEGGVMMMMMRRRRQRSRGQEPTGGTLEVEEREPGGQSKERRLGDGEEWRKRRRMQVFV